MRTLLVGVAVGAAIGLLAALVALVRPELLERGEFWTYDVRARNAADPAEASREIVIVDIAEQDIDDVENNLGLTWPWPRSLFGYVVTYVANAGAKSIALDFLFQDRGVYATNDAEELAAAMAESKRTVFGLVLLREAVAFRPSEGRWAARLGSWPTRAEATAAGLRLMAWNTRVFLVGDGPTVVWYGAEAKADDVVRAWERMSSAEELAEMFRGGAESAPAPEPRELTDAELATELRADRMIRERDGLALGAGSLRLPRRAGMEPPLAILAAAAARLGVVHNENEADGIMRRQSLLFEHDGRYYPSLVLAAWMVANPGVTPELRGRHLYLGARRIGLDDEGKIGIRFHRRGATDAYRHVSAYEILRSQALIDEGKPPSLAADTFKDKYVIVSAAAHALRDLRVSPVAKVHLGAEIQANALDNLLAGEVIWRVPAWLDAIIALLLATLLATAMVTIWNVIPMLRAALAATAALAALAIGGYWLFADALFDHQGAWISFVTPATGGLLAAFAALLVAQAMERRGRRFVQEALGRYTSDELVTELIAHPEHLSLEWGERREMSVYFSDIAGFTSFSEVLPPERLVKLLNEYLTEMTEIVLAHGGVIDKYIGDAIMAFWGAPLPSRDHAHKAVLAALAMRRKCDELRPRWQQEYGTLVIARAGVNSGTAVVGNMGSKHKYNYTVMGDMVNLASRLEGANKPYGTTLMISEFTHALVKDAVDVRDLDLLAVKGKEQPVRVYEVLAEAGRTPPDLIEVVRVYHEALALYRERRFAEARALFASNGDDAPSVTYLARCVEFEQAPPGSDWDGVWHMKEK